MWDNSNKGRFVKGNSFFCSNITQPSKLVELGFVEDLIVNDTLNAV